MVSYKDVSVNNKRAFNLAMEAIHVKN